MTEKKKSKKNNFRSRVLKWNNSISELNSWIRTLTIAVLLGLLLNLIIKPTLVSGQSMYPTLGDRDYLMINRLAYYWSEPHYKDIIVFRANIPGEGERFLIKRIIATEGDIIKIKEGSVWVNGKKLNEPYIHGAFTEGDITVKVPKDCVFVMGDNRENSLDSRFSEVGFVHEKDIVGKVMFRVFPMKKISD